MKNRLLLTVVALVILPTAILSILAGRAVRNRELVIRQQMLLSAENMTRLCSEEIASGLDDELAVLSGRAETTPIAVQAAAEFGPDPAAWLPVFHQRRRPS